MAGPILWAARLRGKLNGVIIDTGPIGNLLITQLYPDRITLLVTKIVTSITRRIIKVQICSLLSGRFFSAQSESVDRSARINETLSQNLPGYFAASVSDRLSDLRHQQVSQAFRIFLDLVSHKRQNVLPLVVRHFLRWSVLKQRTSDRINSIPVDLKRMTYLHFLLGSNGLPNGFANRRSWCSGDFTNHLKLSVRRSEATNSRENCLRSEGQLNENSRAKIWGDGQRWLSVKVWWENPSRRKNVVRIRDLRTRKQRLDGVPE